MSYDVLRSLYFGEATNADIVPARVREQLHVKTGLDGYLPRVIAAGRDLILSGNPGDGKSHLVRRLMDQGALADARVELDLSARSYDEVIRDWLAVRAAAKPFVLCANQGPLREFLEALQGASALASTRAELSAQLGRLTASRSEDLPCAPGLVTVIDLADRNLIDQALIERALARILSKQFWPNVPIKIQAQTSAGRNLSLMAEPRARERLARILVLAGRRAAAHFTFRHIWGAISYAMTAGKQESTLKTELYSQGVGLHCLPLGYLTRDDPRRARNPLAEAVRRFADPVEVSDPQLDQELWEDGSPRAGRWFDHRGLTDLLGEPPATLWREGERGAALERFKQLKRAVTIFHDEGARLLVKLERRLDRACPSAYDAATLKEVAFEGLQRLYLSQARSRAAPHWLKHDLPLWVSNTYLDCPAASRPHVAVDALSADDLEILFPARAPWLSDDVMGAALERAWLSHKPSGISLRLEPNLLARLRAARASEGPVKCPERVQRFLIGVAGWREENAPLPLTRSRYAVLARPRGELIVHGHVSPEHGASATYE